MAMTDDGVKEEAPLLRVRGLSKSFGAIRALEAIDFELQAGEVMALLGENGAGKSTLVKVLAGLYRPDQAEIEIDGEQAELYPASRSDAAGIAVVQQELSLVPTLSAAENVFLGNHDVKGWQTPARLRKLAAPFLDRVGLGHAGHRAAGSMSVAERQLVEVARLLARNARILIFDEPTAALADAEIERVHSVVRSLVAEGKAVVYVTHRLAEVFELADRVTVFREGRSFPTVAVGEIDMDGVVQLMLGRPLENMYPEQSSGFAEPILEARELATDGLDGSVNLSVRRGEILGLVGQLGSGTAPLLEAMGGARPMTGGQLLVDGQPVTLRRVRDAIDRGIGFCSGDRKGNGLFLVRPITENLVAPALNRVSARGWLSKKKERELASQLAGFFTIDRARLRHSANTLSGGNQQKVAVGKWIGIEPRVLLIDEPTRGVDVGARAEIYSHLRKLAEQGMAIIFASSDGQEVLGLADTIATFYRGRLVNTTANAEIDPRRLFLEVTHPSDGHQPSPSGSDGEGAAV